MLETKNWDIYKITNPLGQVYIGRTSNLKGRLHNYRGLNGRTNSQPLLYKSLLEYGMVGHKVEILQSCQNDSGGKGLEIFWIKTFMSNSVKYPFMRGLNKTNGGQGSIGLIHSPTSKLKTNPPRKGKPLGGRQPETLLKYCNNRAKAIIQYDLSGNFLAEYSSVKNATKALKMSSATVCDSLKGRKNPKFIFKYK